LAPAFVGGFASGLEQAEAESGFAIGRIATPSEVAECHLAIREPAGEHDIEPAVVLFALDEGVAEINDAVAAAEFERAAVMTRAVRRERRWGMDGWR
jgi:hypothetical protein